MAHMIAIMLDLSYNDSTSVRRTSATAFKSRTVCEPPFQERAASFNQRQQAQAFFIATCFPSLRHYGRSLTFGDVNSLATPPHKPPRLGYVLDEVQVRIRQGNEGELCDFVENAGMPGLPHAVIVTSRMGTLYMKLVCGGEPQSSWPAAVTALHCQDLHAVSRCGRGEFCAQVQHPTPYKP